ncbi:MAG: diguanylate cyclase [Sulfuricurvum sp.]
MFFPTLGLIATTGVITVDIHESVRQALEKMHRYKHRSIVVLNGPLHYILTTRDIIRLKIEGVSFDLPLSQITLCSLSSIEKERNIVDALSLINEGDEHIAVCNEDGTLYGLVTNSDIIASVDPQIVLESLQISTIFDKKYGFKSFPPQTRMSEVLNYMNEAMGDCVIIQENAKAIGILTSKDVLRFIGENRSESVFVSEVMSSPVVTLEGKASISDGLKFLKEKHFKRIVVTEGEDHVIGIVTQQDLISRTYLKWSQLMKDHFKQFEEITQLLQQKNRHLAKLATKDTLTGINNRYMFVELFEKELALLKRQQMRLSLMMIDLDHFKSVNDRFGHNIGDYVLKRFSETVSMMVREADIFARWGGEEFVLLLRNATCEEAYRVGEKIRMVMETTPFEEVGRITCSVGITELGGSDSLQSAIERADQALYAAKDNGRNCTIACKVD